MYFEYNDIKLYYEKYGNGKNNILILPGWGDNRKTFDYIISSLDKKFSIYIVDYPGFGNSIFPNKDLSIYDYELLFEKFIIENNLTNLIIISHSFGSRIAILLTSRQKVKIDKQIIIDGAGIKPKKKIRSIKTKIYKFLKRINFLIPKKYRKKYLEKLVDIFGSTDYKNLKDSMKKTFSNIVNEDLSIFLPNIKTDSLIIWGEKDIDTPITDGYLMNDKIKDSGLVIIKGATHFSYLEYPLYVINIIKTFLY